VHKTQHSTYINTRMCTQPFHFPNHLERGGAGGGRRRRNAFSEPVIRMTFYASSSPSFFITIPWNHCLSGVIRRRSIYIFRHRYVTHTSLKLRNKLGAKTVLATNTDKAHTCTQHTYEHTNKQTQNTHFYTITSANSSIQTTLYD